MDNLAHELQAEIDSASRPASQQQLEIVEARKVNRERDSLSENFNDELDAWARHALASNGFGDY